MAIYRPQELIGTHYKSFLSSNHCKICHLSYFMFSLLFWTLGCRSWSDLDCWFDVYVQVCLLCPNQILLAFLKASSSLKFRLLDILPNVCLVFLCRFRSHISAVPKRFSSSILFIWLRKVVTGIINYLFKIFQCLITIRKRFNNINGTMFLSKCFPSWIQCPSSINTFSIRSKGETFLPSSMLLQTN